MSAIIASWRWIALALRPGMGCKSFRQFLVQKGDFDKKLPDAQDPWANDALNVIQKCNQHQIQVIPWDSAFYPEWLKRSRWAVPVLYAKGNLDGPRLTPIAMVGTRSPSWNGLGNCKRILQEMETYPCCIVSGLANGIDFACHSQALQRSLSTWAVLAQGLDVPIPSERGRLAMQILQQGGALLSPFPPGTVAHRGCFLARNATIAGIAKATIVLESREQGGAMHTAENCQQDGRILLSVPGDFNRATSQGNHLLLHSGSATPIWFPEQVPDLCGLVKGFIEESISAPSPSSLHQLFQGEHCSFAEIQDRTKWQITEIRQCLGMLAIQGHIQETGGEYYLFTSIINR